jgi:5-methylcytosine-specific restriction endonuclease McrA
MQTKVNSLFAQKHKKAKIPKAVREQVWLTHMGYVFEGKCKVSWCTNHINVFDFQCGHNIPESRGGETNVSNLIPICARCNNSMGNQYTIDEWNKKFAPPPSKRWYSRFICLKTQSPC